MFKELMSISYQQKRPFYNIGHMLGSNAIETDIVFSADGNALYTFHGLPCDCFRNCYHSEQIPVYFEYTRNLTSPENEIYHPNFTLLLLDLKTGGINQNALNEAGKKLFIFYRNTYFHITKPCR
ncbi:sphingomyelinase D A1-like protein [Leptotrombidium deliense]|uniref:Sphingomyelinase D A1-like protein n=1 Tax=Leptotrombidium deliense TaxID=299467 RepID=A0A443RZD3_9ACAR|nr:sphingomyelinase D A1-like protein [Leptotrombidium deliense]